MFAKYLALAFLVAVAVAEFPSFVKVCGRKNPNVDKCVQDSMHELRDRLKGGIPELNLPPQDPLHVDKFTLSDTDSMKATANNVTIKGLGDFVVQSIHIDFQSHEIHTMMSFKKVIFDAEYDVNWRIIVPISGRGPIHIEADDVVADVIMKHKHIKKNGVEYVQFNSVTASLTLKNWTAVFSPSASIDSNLVVAINAAIAGGREEIFKTLKPNIEKVIAEQILDRANKVAQTYSYDEMFPDKE